MHIVGTLTINKLSMFIHIYKHVCIYVTIIIKEEFMNLRGNGRNWGGIGEGKRRV